MITAHIDVTATEYAKEYTILCMPMKVLKRKNLENIFSIFQSTFVLVKKTLLEKHVTNVMWAFMVQPVILAQEIQQTTQYVEWVVFAMMEMMGLENVFVLTRQWIQSFSVKE